MPPRVTVIIPTFNRARYLERALEALGRQTSGSGTFDVVVIDDGSTDDTADVLRKPYPFALDAVTQSNQGPAAARNAGILRSTSDLILFVDDDVVPAPDLISVHLAQHAGEPRVVIGRMTPPEPGRQPFWAEWEQRMLERQYADMVAGRFEPCPRQFYTANASVRREDLVRAGLFDPNFKRAEDIELAYRLERLGLPFAFVSEARVLHDTPRTLAGWIRMAEQYGYYDVVLWRDKGVQYGLEMLAEDFLFARRRSLRAVARIVVGRPNLMAMVRAVAPGLAGAAAALRLRRVSMAGCSALFNLLYWDAFCRELGGRRRFWETLESERPNLSAPAPAVE